jgi:SAM-dependent methyltransferase
VSNRTVRIGNKKVHIPLELFQAMGRPKIIRILPLPKPDIAKIKKYDILDRLAYLRDSIKNFLCFLLNKHKVQLPKLIRLRSVDCRGATYCNNTEFDFIHREFFIINYHPGYFLMPKSGLSESDSREQSWAEIKDYHEHLVAGLQDENANKVSNWLTSGIFKQLKGKSFLEIGCGAGRNLLYIHKNIRRAKTTGIDISSAAIKVAKAQLKKYNSSLLKKSVYDLDSFADNSIDIVFTCGVLMHIPNDKVRSVMKEMHRIAKVAVVHFELDGPAHNFDYHRYPRDYGQIYRDLHMSDQIIYQKFPAGDFRSNMKPPFCHALMVSKIK